MNFREEPDPVFDAMIESGFDAGSSERFSEFIEQLARKRAVAMMAGALARLRGSLHGTALARVLVGDEGETQAEAARRLHVRRCDLNRAEKNFREALADGEPCNTPDTIGR